MHKKMKLFDLIEDFSTAMLVTRAADDSLTARPMVVAEVDINGVLWFVTNKHSGKIDDIVAHRKVALTFQSSKRFVSLAGIAQIDASRSRIEELWRESWRVWFPGGVHDDGITLIQFTAETGEYWDNSGLQGWNYLIKSGYAYLVGDRPDPSETQHAAVDVHGERLPDKIM